jgi:hypothetical protein
MAATLKAPKARSSQPAIPTPVVPTAPAAAEAPLPVGAYRPDMWGLWVWLACAGILLLVQFIDWISALISMVF